jgi:ABC-type Fe2+-enterobactin transport system substrate-binding protein
VLINKLILSKLKKYTLNQDKQPFQERTDLLHISKQKLAKTLAAESVLVSKESMKVLSEFDNFQESDNSLLKKKQIKYSNTEPSFI